MIVDKLETFFFRIATYYQKTIAISFSENNIYIVELQKTIKDLKLICKKTCSYNAEEVKKTLSGYDFKDKIFGINIFNPVVSFRLLSIPKMQENEIENWLEENYNEFLPSTVSIDQIILSYCIVAVNEDIIILLGIVSKNEIDELLSLIGIENNNILKIVPGYSEVAFCNDKIVNKINLVYILNKRYNEVIIQKENRLIFYNQIPASFLQSSKGETKEKLYLRSIEDLFQEDLNLIDYKPELDDLTIMDFRSEGNIEVENKYLIEPEYLPAYILASSLFKNRKGILNFTPKEIKEKSYTHIWKQSLLKSTIGLGSILIFLYLLATICSFIVNTLYNNVVEKNNELQSKLIRLRELKRQKQVVTHDLINAQKIKEFNSESKKLLDALAYHIPKNCWLTDIIYNSNSESDFNTILRGMSRNKIYITELFKNLEKDRNIIKIKLDYIEKINSNDMYRNWKIKSNKYLQFQISIQF